MNHWNKISETPHSITPPKINTHQIALNENLWLIERIREIIATTTLKKEYYPNIKLQTWNNVHFSTNEEIDNHLLLSASDIKKRTETWKWIFYMWGCISYTLYLLNKLKESDLKHFNRNLWIDLYFENNHIWYHTFLQSTTPKIIIDQAVNNNIYIYEHDYTNNSWHSWLTSICNIYLSWKEIKDSDNLLNIINNPSFLHQITKLGEIIPNLKWIDNKTLENMVKEFIKNDNLKKTKDNTKENYENWKKRVNYNEDNPQWDISFDK